MSTLKVDTIQKADGTGSLSVPAESGTVVTTASPSLGRRNLIINGAMQVAQRGTTGYDNGYDSVDRFSWNPSGMAQMGGNSLQSTDAPNGFSNSFGIQVTTAETTIDASESLNCRYEVEARDLQGIANGTSDAKSLTLSFWVKSSVTGTYTVALYKDDNTARLITSTYTISTANTWEQKTFTFAGDTSGGGINNDSGSGLSIVWWLTAGSNKTSTNSTSWMNYAEGGYAYGQTADLASTLNSSWYITGVQLEVGSVATPFEHRSYGEELALCQRYYQRYGNEGVIYSGFGGITGVGNSSTEIATIMNFPCAMRAAPSISYDTLRFWDGSGTATPSAIATSFINKHGFRIDFTVTGAYTNRPYNAYAGNSSTSYLALDAEL